MIRWVLVVLLALVVLARHLTWLERWGLGRIPGDIRFTLLGRRFSLPLGSALLITAGLFVLMRWLR